MTAIFTRVQGRWIVSLVVLLSLLGGSFASPPQPADVFKVKVEDARGKPVKGVHVVAVRATEAEFWERICAGVPAKDWPVEKGVSVAFSKVRTKTNSKGIARFSESCRGLWLVASKRARQRHAPDLLACGRLSRMDANSAEPLVLVLREPRPLQVRAVDADGRPMAGVQITVGKPDARGNLSSWGARRFTTDRAGLVVVPGASAFLPALMGSTGLAKLTLVSPTEAVPFAVSELGEEALELRAPEGRDVEVRLLLPGGEELYEGDAVVTMLPLNMDEVWISAREQCSNGRVLLRGVPLNRDFHMRGSLEYGDLWKRTTFRIEEPGSKPQRVDIVLPEPTWVLSGRLVDTHGKAIQSMVARAGFGLLDQSVLTDDRGDFELLYGAEWGLPGTEIGSIWFGLGDRIGASRPISARETDGVVDLGEIRLERPGELCSGVVRGPDGEPVSGALVELIAQRAKGPVMTRSTVSSVVSDGAGRFTICMLELPGTSYLTVKHDKLVPVVAEWGYEFGESEVVLELAAPGSIEGRVLCEEGSEVFIRLIPRGGDWETPADGWVARPGGDYGGAYSREGVNLRSAFRVSDKGYFSLERFPAGTYDLGVFLPFGSKPLVALEGLGVPEFGQCTDERLTSIAL